MMWKQYGHENGLEILSRMRKVGEVVMEQKVEFIEAYIKHGNA